jgi:hypothetical protein
MTWYGERGDKAKYEVMMGKGRRKIAKCDAGIRKIANAKRKDTKRGLLTTSSDSDFDTRALLVVIKDVYCGSSGQQ